MILNCGSHGLQHAAFVCQHLIDGRALGFVVPFEEDTTPGDPLMAWCETCEIARAEQGEWNDISEAVASIKLVCDQCFDRLRAQNQRG